MSAEPNYNSYFVKFFCGEIHQFSDEDRLLFNKDESRVRMRDRVDAIRNKALLSANNPDSVVRDKFNQLWKLKNANWEKLNDQQKENCRINLRNFAPELFEAKEREESLQKRERVERSQTSSTSASSARGMGSSQTESFEPLYQVAHSSVKDIRRERAACFEAYGFVIEGVDTELLRAELIANGKVGINAEGKIIRFDMLTRNDHVVELSFHQSRNNPDRLALHVNLPDDWEWSMKNAQDTSAWGHAGRGKQVRELFQGDNQFRHGSRSVFSMKITGKTVAASSSQINAPQPRSTPSGPSHAPSSSSSSSREAIRGPFEPVYQTAPSSGKDVKKERAACLESYGFVIEGVDAELLKAELIANGKVGINAEREIVRYDMLTRNDHVVEISFHQSRNNPDRLGLHVNLPDDWEWSMKNAEDTSGWGHAGRGKQVREFFPGDNEFKHGSTSIFSMRVVGSKGAISSGQKEAAQPQAVPARAAALDAKQRKQAEECLDAYGFVFKGVDGEQLRRELVAYGKVGINSDGKIVPRDQLRKDDNVVEISFHPLKSNPGRFALHMNVPDNGKWLLENGQNDSRRVSGGEGKRQRHFFSGNNEFIFADGKEMARPVFGIRVTGQSAAASSHREARPFEPTYSADASSKSPNQAKEEPAISEYEEILGYSDSDNPVPVPREFLVTLTYGAGPDAVKHHFHLFSLIQAMLSQDAPLNPMNRQPVPTDVLKNIAEKIGVDAKDFAKIWSDAEKACPRTADRPNYRLQLFRKMIHSQEGTPTDRSHRKAVLESMAKRDDWQSMARPSRL